MELNEMNLQVICKLTNKCNKACTYCFDKNNRSHDYKMNLDDLVDFFDKITSQCKSVEWIWHGGEITTFDIKEFENLLYRMYIIYAAKTCIVNYSMQTNGFNFNDDWIKLCDKYNIKPGISYDGVNNNLSRGYEMTNEKLMPFLNQITVMNNSNVDKLIEIYEDCKTRKSTLSLNLPFSTPTLSYREIVDVDKLIENYKKFVDYYLYDLDGIAEITTNNFILMSLGKKPHLCCMTDCLTVNNDAIIALNADGYIYACDYISDNYKICKITDYKNLKSLDKSKIQRGPNKCGSCELNIVCKGGCLHRADNGDDLFCRLTKTIVPYLYDKLNDLSPEEFVKLNKNVKFLLLKEKYIPASIKEKHLNV